MVEAEIRVLLHDLLFEHCKPLLMLANTRRGRPRHKLHLPRLPRCAVETIPMNYISTAFLLCTSSPFCSCVLYSTVLYIYFFYRTVAFMPATTPVVPALTPSDLISFPSVCRACLRFCLLVFSPLLLCTYDRPFYSNRSTVVEHTPRSCVPSFLTRFTLYSSIVLVVRGPDEVVLYCDVSVHYL